MCLLLGLLQLEAFKYETGEHFTLVDKQADLELQTSVEGILKLRIQKRVAYFSCSVLLYHKNNRR